MQHFFENLRSNLESLESLPAEEKEALLGRAVATVEQDRTMRPRATAAYLHALRNHRPSHKIRSFVSSPEPANLRGTNQYDPNYLWTGLVLITTPVHGMLDSHECDQPKRCGGIRQDTSI
ncbi:unnamed protein product [Timema podura]|uniref:Uncharacterized protein n=1 Tax=Timema podura TaxID=61482 RepID=A0ABN7NJK8_TIMPD|nr:unnamed protein product [Timema podura]